MHIGRINDPCVDSSEGRQQQRLRAVVMLNDRRKGMQLGFVAEVEETEGATVNSK